MTEQIRPPGSDKRCAYLSWSRLPTEQTPYGAGQRLGIEARLDWGFFLSEPSTEPSSPVIPGTWIAGDSVMGGPGISTGSLYLGRRAPFPGAGKAMWTTGQIKELLQDGCLMANLAAEQIDKQRGWPIRFAGLQLGQPEIRLQSDHFVVTFTLLTVPAAPFNAAVWAVIWAALLALAWLLLGKAFMTALNAGLPGWVIGAAVIAGLCVPPLLAFWIHDVLLGIKRPALPIWTPGQPPALATRTPEAFELQLGRERIQRLQALQQDVQAHPERLVQPQRLRTLETRLQQGIATQERHLGALERARDARSLDDLERLSDAELLLQGIAPESHKRHRPLTELERRAPDEDPS